MTSDDGAVRFRAASILTALGIPIVVVLALFLLLGTIAARKSARVRTGWEATLGSREEVFERFPLTEANAAALEIERLTVPLGIDIATRGIEHRARPAGADSKAHGRIRRELGGYVNAQLERANRRVDPPPAEVAAYLAAHGEGVEALRRHLTGGAVPQWELQLEKLEATPVPNLLGHLELQKVLVADALSRLSRDDHVGASADLAAGWRLNEALRDHPILITQLVSMAVARMHAAALRRLEVDTREWLERLEEHDFRESFVTGLKYEGWHWTQLGQPEAVMATEFPGYLLQRLVKPYVEFCLADVSDDFRKRVVNLDRLEALCDRDLTGLGADLDLAVPGWNVPGKMMVPRLAAAVDRLARLQLDLELTRKVLELEAARQANGGAWPESLPGIERSRACPGDAWAYEVGDGGSMTLTFDRNVSWPDLRGPFLPTRFAATRR